MKTKRHPAPTPPVATDTNWRRRAGRGAAVAVIGGTLLLSLRSGLAPHWPPDWIALEPQPSHPAFNPAPWLMGVALWVFAVILSGILWGLIRQVRRARPGPLSDVHVRNIHNNGNHPDSEEKEFLP